MAFDITPYVDMSPKKVRELIRKGVIDFPHCRNVPWLCAGKYGCRHQQYDCQHQHCQE